MILITGATGFLGSYLAKDLISRGEKLRAIKRATSNFELLGDYAKQIEWVEGDLMDITSVESAVKGIEKIYHCAGEVSHTKSGMMVNTKGAANLFNAALHTEVKKVVHVSSTIALGAPVNDNLIDENYYATNSKQGSEYFESKRFGELEAWRAQAEGLQVVVVNPAALIGAGRWGHGPLNAFKAVNEGLNFYPEGGNGFMDVRDATAMMIKLMESDVDGERVILVSCNLTLKEYLNEVADALQKPHPKYAAGKWLAAFAWRFEALRALVNQHEKHFDSDDMAVAQIAFKYNNENLKRFAACDFRDIRTTIRETAQCFLESKKKGLDYGVFA